MPNRPDAIKKDWHLLITPPLIGGVNSRDLPHMIDEAESPNIFGLRPEHGTLVQDSGFSTYDSNDGAVGHPRAIFGIPLAVFEFNRLSGTTESLLITTATAYKLVANSRYELLATSVSTTLSATRIAGTFVFAVTSSVGFVAGQYIGIYLDDGTMHMATITGVVPGQISISPTEALPSTATIGNGVIQGAFYSASANNHITGVTLPVSDTFVFTNEIDYVQSYNGSTIGRLGGTSTVMPLAESLDACTTLSLWKGYLLLGGTKENGIWRRWRVRRSDVNNHTEWTNGDAGYDDLSDSRDDIEAMRPLGDYNVIYRSRSIIRQEYIGSADNLFRYRNLTHGSLFESTGVGIVGPGAVFSSLDKQYFVASDGVYEYSGGYSIQSISGKIEDSYFSRDGIVQHSDLRRIRMSYDEENKLLLIFIRTSDAPSAYDNRILVYDVVGGGWFVRYMLFSSNGVGIFRSSAIIPWGSLIGSWGEQNWVWGGGDISAETPRVVVGSMPYTASIWRPAQYGYSGNDLGEPIIWGLETRDINAYDRDMRIDYIEAVISGEVVELTYSVDRGNTWIPLYNWSNLPERSRERVHHNINANIIRYRYRGYGGGGGVDEIMVKIKEAARW